MIDERRFYTVKSKPNSHKQQGLRLLGALNHMGLTTGYNSPPIRPNLIVGFRQLEGKALGGVNKIKRKACVHVALLKCLNFEYY